MVGDTPLNKHASSYCLTNSFFFTQGEPFTRLLRCESLQHTQLHDRNGISLDLVCRHCFGLIYLRSQTVHFYYAFHTVSKSRLTIYLCGSSITNLLFSSRYFNETRKVLSWTVFPILPAVFLWSVSKTPEIAFHQGFLPSTKAMFVSICK